MRSNEIWQACMNNKKDDMIHLYFCSKLTELIDAKKHASIKKTES